MSRSRTENAVAGSLHDRGIALTEARFGVTGQAMDPTDATLLAARGWTPERYAVIERLARWAAGQPEAEDGRWWARAFARAAEQATLRYAPWAELLPWLVVLAGEPDGPRQSALEREVTQTNWIIFMGRWPGVPADVAALAYASGLTGAEVADRYAVGDLTEAGLRALAALRGYRLPDVIPAPGVDR